MIINHLKEGGAGSGYYGHRDVKGRRGGSAPGGGHREIWYHGTVPDNLKSIMESGLMVNNHGLKTTEGSSSAGVYLSADRELPEAVGAVNALMHGEDKFAVLKIDASGLPLQRDPKSVITENAQFTEATITPDRILKVEKYKIDPIVVSMYKERLSEISKDPFFKDKPKWNLHFSALSSAWDMFPGDGWIHRISESVSSEDGNIMYAPIYGEAMDRVEDFIKNGNKPSS